MAEIKEEVRKLADWTMQKFKDSMVAKEKFTIEWMESLNAWNNSLFTDQATPSYKSNQSSNFIYSTIESMRPIMFDNDPKFEAIPVTLDSVPFTADINRALDWEWHRTQMSKKCISNSIYTFTIGTSIMMLPYVFSDKPQAEVDGDVEPIQINPFNLFPDPLATSVEDAEYIIYATYQHVNVLKKLYPEFDENLDGADIQYQELVNYRNEGAKIMNQVLVIEMWMRDYTTIEVEEEDSSGGTTTTKKAQYPLGRVLTTAPELGLVLKDEENPYETGRFPFFIFKDIDVPFQFWGEGEVKWLLSPQKSINDLSNQIIDNAKHTANQIWVIDKNAGIPKGSIINRPGLIIRKNPGSEVRRDSPPSMPMYVSEKINSLKTDIEVISGVHDVTRGQNPSGIESGAAIAALQEAANTRIRLKTKLHEYTLGDIGTEWLARMKQYWKFDRIVPVDKPQEQSPMGMGQQMQGMEQQNTPEAKYDFITISQDKQLSQSYRVKVIGASTMSVNAGTMFDFMLRLAQTPAEDGLPMVSREAVLDFVPKVNKERILQLFKIKQQEQMMQQQQQMMGQEQVGQMQNIMGGMAEQMQGINNDLGGVQGRLAQEDQTKADNDLKSQGYDMAMKESMAMEQQSQGGEVPPELLEQMANMSDEELMQLLQENPELADVI